MEKKQLTVNDVSRPGVFRVVCTPLNKAYFKDSVLCFTDARKFFEGLDEGFCENSDLLADYQK